LTGIPKKIAAEATSTLKYPMLIQREISRVVEIESAFVYGFQETVKYNLDFVFRWLYIVAFLIQVAIQFTAQTGDYSILIGFILVGLLLMSGLMMNLVNYRAKQTNISMT
jgi:hypothetical protein